ncbi:MAG: ergothioneine biosynthesis glutamate--cysteine ligase EgtA [Mycobacteriaceae bacterium]|nr:ergothioneine biosynthesis glutamate--cysteine ligase EgtA [Mycobacteriaceae bacterium]
MAETTLAVTSDVHQAPLGSLTDAADHISSRCLADSAVGLVGLELEAHCFDVADPMRRPGWQDLCAVLDEIPELPFGSRVTVEPGGAVELSTPPARGVVAAIEGLTADRAVLRTVFATAGLGLVLLGADPLRPPHRINPGARYRAMEQHFAAARTGAAGAAMMTSTASIQVNLDAGPAGGWADRVRLAHALGPMMIAIAANSPLLSGSFSGWRSTRQRVWSQLDTARCGPVLGANGDDPASDWARYALRAPVMLVHNSDGSAEPVKEYVAFADWVDGDPILAGRRPTTADLDYHLTTLFPPVRPRGWLEIRYLDTVPDALWPALVFTLVALLDDPALADVAAAATEPVATAWDVAARIGLADRRLHACAVRCVQAAAQCVPPTLWDSMQRLVRLVERASCPGDEFAERAIRRGVPTAVTEMAGGEA